MKRGLSIGDLAARTGLSISSIRFYETKGLVSPDRNAGGQRRYEGSDIRRLSFVMIAQKMGLTIEEIREIMDGLPGGRTPTQSDWAKISEGFRSLLNARIALMERMRDRLDGCIGCGCLSLEHCALYNPDDQAAQSGAGPQFILQEMSPSQEQENT